MNIGMFTDTYYPEINGVATSVYLLKKELEAKGHTVYVITTTSPDAPSDEKNVLRVPSMSCSFVPERRIGLVYQPSLAMKVFRMKLDVIHTHTEFSIGIFGRLMAKELMLPVVHTYHTIYEDYTHYIKNYISNEERAKKLARIYSRFSVNGAEEIVVPTTKVKELLGSYGVNADISVIPTGINLDAFYKRDSVDRRQEYRKELGIESNEKAILYLGRISKEKNIDELILYLDEYFDKRQDGKFVIIGDGQYRKDVLEPLVNKCRNKERIIFAGARPWNEITHYYQAADLFVSASQSETQGLTYIEALASGLPVVAKKDDCLIDVIVQGVNGYSYETKDEFFCYLDNVLCDNNIMSTNDAYIGPWTEAACESVEKFSTNIFANRIENIYYHVINSHDNVINRLTDKVAGKIADRIGYERIDTMSIPTSMPTYLGDSNIDVSRIVLGCMRMADLSEKEAARIIATALDLGITMFDHADIYGGGASETLFGKVLQDNKGLRDKMRIQSKCGICDGYYDLSTKHIINSVEQSLMRLNTEYLDVLLLHRPDALMDPYDVAAAFDKLQSSGKVKAFGVSNFNAMQITMLQEHCRQTLLVNQLQFGLGHTNLVDNGIFANTNMPEAVARDGYVLDYCRHHNITIQAWSPLQYGMFEGSILDEGKFPKLNQVLEALSNQYKVSKATIAIAWILKHPADMQAIVGTMNMEHLKDLCMAKDIVLTKPEWYELYQAAISKQIP